MKNVVLKKLSFATLSDGSGLPANVWVFSLRKSGLILIVR